MLTRATEHLFLLGVVLVGLAQGAYLINFSHVLNRNLGNVKREGEHGTTFFSFSCMPMVDVRTRTSQSRTELAFSKSWCDHVLVLCRSPLLYFGVRSLTSVFLYVLPSSVFCLLSLIPILMSQFHCPRSPVLVTLPPVLCSLYPILYPLSSILYRLSPILCPMSDVPCPFSQGCPLSHFPLILSFFSFPSPLSHVFCPTLSCTPCCKTFEKCKIAFSPLYLELDVTNLTVGGNAEDAKVNASSALWLGLSRRVRF